jgi:hypothetical protein
MVLNIALGSLILLGAGTFGLSNGRKVAAMASYPGISSQDQNATSRIAQDLRQACSIESAASDRIVLRTRDAAGAELVSYSYNTAQRTLTREDGHSTVTVLSELDNFSFSLFQRPASQAAFGAFARATAANAGMVGCHWTCSRKLGGTKLDSEHVEMAPVVLRNHH